MHAIPHLSFEGGTRDAMQTYQSIFGGELTILTYADTGMVEPGSPHADAVAHAALTSGHLRLYAADYLEDFAGGVPLAHGSAVEIALSGEHDADGETMREVFAKLAEGGRVNMPLAIQEWGDEFGSVTDRFGMGWNVNIAIASAKDGAAQR